MGRRMQWPDKIIAPLPAGTLFRIGAVLGLGETKTDFLRAAVLLELERRERLIREDAPAGEKLSPVEERAASPAGGAKSATVHLDRPPKPDRRERRSRQDVRHARKLAKARRVFIGLSWPPSCQRQFCGVRATFICAETDETFCSDHPDQEPDIVSAVDMLTEVVDHETGRVAGPQPRPRSAKRTSALKRKTLTLGQSEALAKVLKGRQHKYVSLAQWFLWFGVDLGLRPVEWHTARVSNGSLIVQNAKHTRDRACGPTRSLDLCAFGETYIRNLTEFLRCIRSAVVIENGDWDKVAEGVRRALQDASRATGDKALQRRPVCLYTLRHVACARAKASGYSLVEIAAMMGHASDATATENYAHARSARGWPKLLTVPSPENVARVREVYVSREQRQHRVRAAESPRP